MNFENFYTNMDQANNLYDVWGRFEASFRPQTPFSMRREGGEGREGIDIVSGATRDSISRSKSSSEGRAGADFSGRRTGIASQ